MHSRATHPYALTRTVIQVLRHRVCLFVYFFIHQIKTRYTVQIGQKRAGTSHIYSTLVPNTHMYNDQTLGLDKWLLSLLLNTATDIVSHTTVGKEFHDLETRYTKLNFNISVRGLGTNNLKALPRAWWK
jgi:hypothetical protein